MTSNIVLLKETEASVILSISIATLRRWRWSGRGPGFVKLGSAVRYDSEELWNFIDAGRRRSTTDPVKLTGADGRQGTGR
jgi:predicted site-specific integrase-resolvase